MAPKPSAHTSGLGAFSARRAEPQKRAGSWAGPAWTEGGESCQHGPSGDSGSSVHGGGRGRDRDGETRTDKAQGARTDKERSQEVGWLDGVGHGDTEGMQEGREQMGILRAVSRDDQEVGEREIGVVRAEAQGIYLVLLTRLRPLKILSPH